MIFVTKNGKEEGPYSERQVKKYLMSNRFAINDLARHEGDAKRTPLSHLLNLTELLEYQQSSPSKGTFLIWLISISYILFFGLGIIVFACLRFGMSAQQWQNEQGKPVGELLSTSRLIPMFISAVLAVAGAVMLLLSKKSALYFFLALFAVDFAQTMTYAVPHGWRSALGDQPAFPIGIWAIQIAVILYSMRLIKRGVLK